MISILGYSANASAVRLDIDKKSDHYAIHYAAAFWLVIKLTRGESGNCFADPVFMLLLYAIRLPKFRSSQLLQAVAVFIPMTIYMPLLWVRMRPIQIALASAGLVTDVMRVDLLVWNFVGRWQSRSGHQRSREQVEVKWWGMPILKPGVRIPGE